MSLFLVAMMVAAPLFKPCLWTHCKTYCFLVCILAFVRQFCGHLPESFVVAKEKTELINMKQYLSLTPERECGHGHVVEFDDVWFPPSSPPAITTTASPRFSKKQLFAVVTVLSAAVVLVAVLSYGIKNDGKLGRIGSFQAASIDVNIDPDIFPNDIEADANPNLLDLGEIHFFLM